jgi:hypothetical protein
MQQEDILEKDLAEAPILMAKTGNNMLYISFLHFFNQIIKRLWLFVF